MAVATCVDGHRGGAADGRARPDAREELGPSLGRRSRWIPGRLPHDIPDGRHDLVTLGYVLAELDDSAQRATLERAWASGDAVVVVEPGTPAGYRRLLAARERLIELGGTLAAPCPHERACPLAGTDDWCHFAVRLARSAAHRAAKSAELGHEDEKLAYVAVVREPIVRATERVLRHPQLRSGHVLLQLCTPSGIERATVSKRDGERYRRARQISWGEDLGGEREEAPSPGPPRTVDR